MQGGAFPQLMQGIVRGMGNAVSVGGVCGLKEGFSVPIKHWLKTTLRPQMEGLLSAGQLREAGLST
jgi:hypothetical protein